MTKSEKDSLKKLIDTIHTGNKQTIINQIQSMKKKDIPLNNTILDNLIIYEFDELYIIELIEKYNINYDTNTLFTAIKKNNFDLVKYLVMQGVDLNKKINKQRLIEYLLFDNNIEIPLTLIPNYLSFLINNGAKYSFKSKFAYFPDEAEEKEGLIPGTSIIDQWLKFLISKSDYIKRIDSLKIFELFIKKIDDINTFKKNLPKMTSIFANNIIQDEIEHRKKQQIQAYLEMIKKGKLFIPDVKYLTNLLEKQVKLRDKEEIGKTKREINKRINLLNKMLILAHKYNEIGLEIDEKLAIYNDYIKLVHKYDELLRLPPELVNIIQSFFKDEEEVYDIKSDKDMMKQLRELTQNITGLL